MRDHTLRRRAVAALAAAVAAAAVAAAPPEEAGSAVARRAVPFPIRTMGTYANVTIVTDDSARTQPAAALAHRSFAYVDSLMTNWTETSEVARINRVAATRATVVEREVARVLDEAVRVGRASEGAMDITVEPLVRLWGFLGGPRRVPAEDEVAAAFRRVGWRHLRWNGAKRSIRFDTAGVKIDLGGIAKGYAVDRAASKLAAAGVTDALVDLSGNMRGLGAPPGVAHWRIGVRDPRDRVPYFARVPLDRGGIATSGKYEQFVAANGRTYGHILDPRTGRPAEGLIAVTVLARSAMEADAWDTGLFVLGLDGARRIAKAHPELDVILVAPGAAGVDTVWVESSLRERFVLEDAAREHFRVAWF